MGIYYVNAGWIDPEYFEGYLWSEGYWNAEYIEADTRGKARAKFIALVNERGDDVQWTDKISIHKVDAIPEPKPTLTRSR